LRYQSTTGLTADQIEELVVRVWQIVQCRKTQAWPPVVGLYRAVALTLVYVRRHTPEQIIRKVCEGEKLLGQDMELPEVLKHLEITEATWYRWRTSTGA
jgi:hypothetical protein